MDHSKAGGITRRANIAALSFQTPGHRWHINVHQSLTGRSPSTTPVHSSVLKRMKKRRLFTPGIRNQYKNYVQVRGDKSYGDFAQQPDIPLEVMEQRQNDDMKSLRVSRNDELQNETKRQIMSEKWKFERSKTLPSSLFKEIADRRSTTLSSNLI